MDLDTFVKLKIYEMVACTTRLPASVDIALLIGSSIADVEQAFQRLYEKRLLVSLDQLWQLAVNWSGNRLTIASRRPAPDEMVENLFRHWSGWTLLGSQIRSMGVGYLTSHVALYPSRDWLWIRSRRSTRTTANVHHFPNAAQRLETVSSRGARPINQRWSDHRSLSVRAQSGSWMAATDSYLSQAVYSSYTWLTALTKPGKNSIQTFHHQNRELSKVF